MQNPEEKGKRAQKKKNIHRETKKIIRNKVNSSNIKINKHKSKQTELIWSSGVVLFVFFLVFCCSTCFRLPLFVMCFFALGFAVFLVFVVLIWILHFLDFACKPRHNSKIPSHRPTSPVDHVLINYIYGIYTYTYTYIYLYNIHIHIHMHIHIHIHSHRIHVWYIC